MNLQLEFSSSLATAKTVAFFARRKVRPTRTRASRAEKSPREVGLVSVVISLCDDTLPWEQAPFDTVFVVIMVSYA